MSEVTIVEFLRTKIADPLHRTVDFIWVGFPKNPDVSYPRISVTPVGGSRTSMSIGNNGDRYGFTLQIDIFTDTEAQYVRDGHTYTQLDLCTDLYTQLKNAVRDNKCSIIGDNGTIDLWITPYRMLPYDETLDLYRLVFTLYIQQNDPKT
jgi:hypothetical protein